MSRFVFMLSVVLPLQRYSTLFVTLECFAHKKKKYLFFSVQHFITVCNIVCANGGNICISIKYMSNI